MRDFTHSHTHPIWGVLRLQNGHKWKNGHFKKIDWWSLIKFIGNVSQRMIKYRGYKSWNWGHWWWGVTHRVCKRGQMGQKVKCWKNRQKWSKNDEIELKESWFLVWNQRFYTLATKWCKEKIKKYQGAALWSAQMWEKPHFHFKPRNSMK